MPHQSHSQKIPRDLGEIISKVFLAMISGLSCFFVSGCSHDLASMPRKHIQKVRVILRLDNNYPINPSSLKSAALDLFPKGTAYETIERYFEKEVDIGSMEVRSSGKPRFIYAKHNTESSTSIGVVATWGSFPYYSHLFNLGYIFNKNDEVEEVRSGLSTESF